MNPFVLNLQTYEGIKEGLRWIFGERYKDFNSLLAQYVFSDDIEEKEQFTLDYIEEEIKIEWDRIDLDNLYVKVFHFTTRNEEEPNQDIYNLNYLLSTETQFSEFFRSYKVEFDLDNSRLKVNDKVYDLTEEGLSVNDALYWIQTKLYIDPEIWGFVRVKDIRDYNSDFPNRPEFISHVANLLDFGTSILEDWDNTYGVPYVIEFKQPFHSVKILSDLITYKKGFMRKEFLSERELENVNEQYILEMKKGLCDLLIALCMDNISRHGVSELAKDKEEYVKGLLNNRSIEKLYGGFGLALCAVLPKNANVSKNQITKVWNFEEFQKSAKCELGFISDD